MSEATFVVIITAMGGAIVSLAGLLWRERGENMELRIKLAAYEQAAPELIRQVRLLMHQQSGGRGGERSELSRPLRRHAPRAPRRVQ